MAGRDILYMSEGQKAIAKLEFVYDEEDFTIAELYDFVKNRENTLECAKLRVKLGIVRLFHTYYKKLDTEMQNEMLQDIHNKESVARNLIIEYNYYDKIACLAERRSFATENLSYMIALNDNDSESVYRDADKMIRKEVSRSKKADFSSSIDVLFQKVYGPVHLRVECGMNVLD